MASFSDVKKYRSAQALPGNDGVTRMVFTVELTKEEAGKLPAAARIKSNFPGVQTVDSQVRANGSGELILTYYMSNRPYRGATPNQMPRLVRRTLEEWLAAGAPAATRKLPSRKK